MSPDGQDVVTGAGDETVRFWKVFPFNAVSPKVSTSMVVLNCVTKI